MSARIVPLAAEHATGAARLHVAGQPGTFLTSLGEEVLAVIYRALPDLPSGFGFAALDAGGRMAGFVSATTGVGRLFMEISTQRAGQLLPPLAAQMVRRPALLWRSAQTMLYPLLARDSYSQGDHAQTAAELLSIMVEPEARSQGIGTRLLDALLAECATRRIGVLDVTVDVENAAAQRFYRRHGFAAVRTFTLYGRAMQLYRRGV